MSRLIDADALLYVLETVPLTDDGGVDINDLEDIINRLPTIDAVPVIRCKDCKLSEAWYGKVRRCFLWNDETGVSVWENGYCSYAERRSDDGV